MKSNFLCNLGYGDRSTLYPRSPRLGVFGGMLSALGPDQVPALKNADSTALESDCSISISNREALSNVRSLFQFVDHRHGIILDRDPAVAVRITKSWSFPNGTCRSVCPASSLGTARERTTQVPALFAAVPAH